PRHPFRLRRGTDQAGNVARSARRRKGATLSRHRGAMSGAVSEALPGCEGVSKPSIPSACAGPPSRSSLCALAVLLGALLACGDVKEKLTELVVEKSVEQAGGGQVDVNLGK